MKAPKEYLSTFSLLHSMDAVVRVLTEIKVREEEYEMIKKISGSPTCNKGAAFATSIHLFLVDVDDDLTMTTAQRPGISQYFPPVVATRSNTPYRSSRLANATNHWDAKRSKPEPTT